jgi:hypothetical protein
MALMWIERPLQQFDEICRHLLDSRGGLGKQVYGWMEADLRADLERLSHDCKQIVSAVQCIVNYCDGQRDAEQVRCSIGMMSHSNYRRSNSHEKPLGWLESKNYMLKDKLNLLPL